jgi:uncharacterized protein YqjF (DUF2071 family)
VTSAPGLTVRSLKFVKHRPWPVPAAAWAWRQSWHDLLLMHWPVPAPLLRAVVPAPMNIHKYHGTGWVGVMPFWISGMQHRQFPLPRPASCAMLSVHTYVIRGGRPGIWVLSLDTGSKLAAWVARWLLHLPCVCAGASAQRDVGRMMFRSQRGDGAGLEVRYSPEGEPAAPHPGTLEHWFTDRYALYGWGPGQTLQRSEIHHLPWRLQPAAVALHRNDMLHLHGLEPNGMSSRVWYTRRLEIVGWPRASVPAVVSQRLGTLRPAWHNR